MAYLEDSSVSRRHGERGNYDADFARAMVKLLEEGNTPWVLCEKHNISRKSLYRWSIKYGSEAYLHNIRRGISVKEKRSVVRALEAGRMTGKEAMLAYGVSDKTIGNWKKLYMVEKEELVISNVKELGKKKTKQQEVIHGEEMLQLRQQLKDAQLKIAALNTLIDVAEEELKINIRKKPGARRS